MINRLILYSLLLSMTCAMPHSVQAQVSRNTNERSIDSALSNTHPTIMASLMHARGIKASDILSARRFNRRSISSKNANQVEVISSKEYARFSFSRKYNSFASEYNLTILQNKYQLGTSIKSFKHASCALFYFQPTVKTIHTCPSNESIQLECQAGLSMASDAAAETKVEQLNPHNANRLFGLFSWVGRVAIKLNLHKTIKKQKRI